MSAPHTPGRLTAMPRGRIVGGPFLQYVNGEAQEQIACVMGLQSNPDPGASQEADTRRLAACWNACEGVSTEVLETAGTRHDWCDLMQELEKERDELAAALRGLLEAHAVPSSACKDRPAYEAAVAALAKIQDA